MNPLFPTPISSPLLSCLAIASALLAQPLLAVNIASTEVAADHVAFSRSSFFNAVVALQLTSDGSTIGSGVLIAPNKVLVSAVNLIGPDGGDSSDTSLLSIGQFNGTTNSFVRSYSVISATRHPSWTPGGGTVGVELAVLELSEPMTGVTPAQLASSMLGTEGAFAGFGIQGTGLVTDLTLPGAGARLAAMNRVTSLSTAPGDDLSNYWVTDFDNGDAALDTDGNALPSLLEGGLSDADNGTGLWVRTGPGPDDWGLAGILLGHGNEVGESGAFGDIGIWTRLDLPSNRAFINSQAVPEPGTAAFIILALAMAGRRRGSR
jgi:hypothetical protein